MSVPRLLVSLTAAAALAAGTLAAASPPGTAAADPQSVAAGALRADASGALTTRSSGGVYDFVGVPAGVRVDDPAVTPASSVEAAAAAHLARYGAAFGTDQPGTTISELRAQSTVAGDVVRYQQRVGGVPVMGGELVVSLRPDRELASILAKTSRATRVPAATVTEAAAEATAQSTFQRSAGQGAAAHVTRLGRWVVDPALVGTSAEAGTRTAWRFELSRGEAERQVVLVDDRTGGVLVAVDTVAHVLKRVVCDNANVPRVRTNSDEAPCTNPALAARVEGGAATGNADVDGAYDLAKAVSDTYAGIGVDLTALIGRTLTDGTKALAQTVRLCYTTACPYENAFWNGSQMYYGTGFAVADDVVGHEMTHGVTERSSNLVYWGQSGAMNESISDIMGEIVDHQYTANGTDAPGTAWALGEDIPGVPNGIRDIKDPTIFNDPDKMTSTLYVKEPCCSYPDSDGVHTNSGVGNKTFYLASQGGTFNGQTITGIDAGDPNLTKSAKLWLLVDQSLSSGSDYADEAALLEQSCATLQGAGAMTAANCAAVHQATLATELRTTPTKNPQPADATVTCPAGTTARVLLDSESGTPTSKFTAGGASWSRNGIPGFGQVAHSAPGAWSNSEPATAGAVSLTAAAPVALPAGQASYLFFQQWRLLDYDGSGFYDAGTVEVNGADTSALPWVNGPVDTIFSGSGNPAAGKKGFGGDSRGYVASRLDLTSFAGQSVTPRFTMNTDSTTVYLGWYVDDVLLYTCDKPVVLPPPPPPAPGSVVPGAPTISGKAKVGKVLTAQGGTWGPAPVTLSYQWLRNGSPIPGATGGTYKLKNKDKGKKISVTVTGTKSGYTSASATSPATGKVKPKKKKHHHRRVVAQAARLE